MNNEYNYIQNDVKRDALLTKKLTNLADISLFEYKKGASSVQEEINKYSQMIEDKINQNRLLDSLLAELPES